MPRGDRTGPMGAGPRTGRQAGYCAGSEQPGFAQGAFWGYGRGVGRGYGCGGPGRGWRHQYLATAQPGWMRFGMRGRLESSEPAGVEKSILEERAQTLRSELDAIQNRLSEIEE